MANNCVCYYCEVPLTKFGPDNAPTMITWDHIIPKAKGGASDYSNLVAACLKCNKEKGTLSEDEFRTVLWHRAQKARAEKMANQPTVFFTREISMEDLKFLYEVGVSI
jgi:5-methylcytosine-specific restriction endonuclease McrA